MVYGGLARSGVYAVQQLMRLLASVGDRGVDVDWKVTVLREVLGALPATHPLKANAAIMVLFVVTLSLLRGFDLFIHFFKNYIFLIVPFFSAFSFFLFFFLSFFLSFFFIFLLSFFLSFLH